jgi:hypothetical protein
MKPSYKYTEQFIQNDVNYNLPYGKPIFEYEYRNFRNKKSGPETEEKKFA